MIRGSGCSKSRLAKAAGAEVAVQQRNEKWHDAVARSAFSSQNAQKATCSEPFSIWKNGTPLWREAHLYVKMHKTLRVGPIFEGLMPKNGTPLWHEAHFQLKMYKTLWREARWPVNMFKNSRVQTTFWSSDVEKGVSQ